MTTNGSGRGEEVIKYGCALSILLVVLLGACVSHTPTPSPTPSLAVAAPPIAPDYWPTEGWRTTTPEEQGMDSQRLAQAIDYLKEQDDFNIHSLLIIRSGYIVTDAYFHPFAQGSLHDIASVTKSFMSTLIGIAMDKGYIESTEEHVLDFFPERTVANLDANKGAMTLEDLLTMRSGLECINQPTEVTLEQMMASPDWVQFALDLPMAAEPGTRFVYCSPNVHLLSAIIQEATGMSALAFAQEHLFGPLGVSDVIWPPGPQGNNWGWGEMKLGPHDMAKLGYLYLNEGLWDGQQILSSAWVKAATSSVQPVSIGYYGYLWWLTSVPHDLYRADGRGGQTILVLPQQNLVVVTTGGGGRDLNRVLETLLTAHIVPAIESATPLPANPDGLASLESKIEDAAAPEKVQPELVPPLPEMARQVAGQTFFLDDNPYGLLSVSLTFPEDAEAVLSLGFADGNQTDWLIGLDNVSRFSAGRYGLTAAAKGWWETDNAFVLHLDEIGNIDQRRISASFEGDQVTLQIQDLTGLGGVTLVGRLEG